MLHVHRCVAVSEGQRMLLLSCFSPSRNGTHVCVGWASLASVPLTHHTFLIFVFLFEA